MPSSSHPIIISHHIMWTLYGWWLPNDPRGSTSRTIRNDLIAELGELHTDRKRIQPASRDIREFYAQAAAKLKHPLMSFEPAKFHAAAESIQTAIQELGLTCDACAIMPDHVHLVVRKHRMLAEAMIEEIQRISRQRLALRGVREVDHPTWTRGEWKVFLDHP